MPLGKVWNGNKKAAGETPAANKTLSKHHSTVKEFFKENTGFYFYILFFTCIIYYHK
jgi:hypothetical protein